AVWENGNQVCGILKTPIKEVFRQINEGVYDNILLKEYENQKPKEGKS
ncbi:unnamed protein product, partial [marine sediment metagenome]